MQKQKYQPKNNGENRLTMAQKLGMGPEIRTLKLGPTFTNGKGTSYHTLKYDFQPASVDLNKVATVEVGSNNQMTVTVPHLDGSGTTHTVFKGSQRPYQKECVLIIDKVTGEITLEKLSSNIQVKKTRISPAQKPASVSHPSSLGSSHQPTSRPGTPVDSANASSNSQHKKPSSSSSSAPSNHSKSKNIKPSATSRPKLATTLSGLIPKHSPLHASPNYPTSRSPHQKSPPTAGLPVIGGSDMIDFPQDRGNDLVGVLSDTSSDSSSDSGSSDSESDSGIKSKNVMPPVNGTVNGTSSPSLSMPDHFLTEDLRLSETGSDSD